MTKQLRHSTTDYMNQLNNFCQNHIMTTKDYNRWNHLYI